MDGASDEAQRKRNGIDVLSHFWAGSRRQTLHHHIFFVTIVAGIDVQQGTAIFQFKEAHNPAVLDKGCICVYVAIPVNTANGYEAAEVGFILFSECGTGKPVDANTACETAFFAKVVLGGLYIEVA